MVLKLYGLGAPSYNTHLVALILYEKKVPFEFVVVELRNKEHRLPEYLKLQPFGQIPCIDDDGFILYESKAICHYIASKYPDQGTPLLPTGLKATALFHQAAYVDTYHFAEHVNKIIFEKNIKPLLRLTPDQKVFDQLIAELGRKLDVYEQILSKQKYLVGDEVTLVDLYHIPNGTLLVTAGSNIMQSRPNVDRWFKDICSRPAWLAVKDRYDSTSSYE